MIVFETLRFKNFLGTGNNFIEISLNGYQATYICGTNGAGKSTFIDALCFALFKKPFREINIPQLVNSINKKDCVVEVDFSTGGKKYRIVRGVKPNIFEIYENGTLIKQDASVNDYQSHLETNILKLSYKSFVQIVVLGSRDYVPFMKLKTPARREVIEDILDIEIFSEMNKIVKTRISVLKNGIEKLDREIQILHERKKVQERHIQEVSEELDATIVYKEDELSAKTDELSVFDGKLGELNDELTQLANKAIDENIRDKLDGMNVLKAKIRANKDIVSKSVAFYETNSECPTCKQGIDEDFKAGILAESKNNLQEYEDGIEKIDRKIVTIKCKLDEAEKFKTDIADKNREIWELKQSQKSLKDSILTLKTEIDKLREKRDNPPVVDLTSIQTELDEKQKELNSAKRLDQYYKYIAELLKDTGIKTKIIKKYLPSINKLVNQYLEILNLFVKFTFDENFSELLKSRYYDEFSYGSFSQGQKSRIDLALMFTWREIAKLKNSMNTNLLILDETFDSSLDGEGTESLLHILGTLGKKVNVFVVSHKLDMEEHFDRTLRFSMEKNFTKIS